MWRADTLKSLRGRWLIAVVVIAALLGSWGIIRLLQVVHQSTTERGATATYRLLQTTKQLDASFGHSTTSSTARHYVGYLNSMDDQCRAIQHLKATAALPTTTGQLLNNGSALCDDLTKLADYSKQVYVATGPLLEASSHVKRYQTLPFISSRIKQRQLNQTTTAARSLNDQVRDSEFPTAVMTLLEQLKVTIQQRSGLQYFPALQTFQNQLLGERQQYWTAYGDLSSLQASLSTQLSGYCQQLRQQHTAPRLCQKY